MKILYSAEATATGGRQGRVWSSDGAVSLDLVIPKELGGPGGTATNPEQLFAAGFAACYDNAVRLVARRNKMRLVESSVTARVGIGPNDSGGYDLAVELHVRLPDLDRDHAEQLARQAHQICPYSNATRGNIDVQIIVEPASDLV